MPLRKGHEVEDEMRKFKAGELHSGSKNGPIVKSRAQAIKIGLEKQRENKRK